MALAATTPRETPLARILGDASIEIIAGHSGVPTLSSDYAPGTRVHVTFLPSDDLSTAAETCVALRRGGFEPVPHLTARNFASRDVLERHLARLTGEAGVTRALVIAGDVDRPRGELKTSMDVLKTGLLERHGIKSILLAGTSRRPSRGGERRPRRGAARQDRVCARRRTGGRDRDAVLLRGGAGPGLARAHPRREDRRAAARRRRGPGGHRDAAQIRAPLRHRQFAPGAAQAARRSSRWRPSRPIRKAFCAISPRAWTRAFRSPASISIRSADCERRRAG